MYGAQIPGQDNDVKAKAISQSCSNLVKVTQSPSKRCSAHLLVLMQ
jgi:hypothetical protein